jgi:hypothetical protein
MGRRFYGKIVSLLGSGFGKGKGGFFKNMLKLKMMSSMLGGNDSGEGFGGLGGNGLAMMMLMGNGSMDGIFDGFGDDEDDEDDEGRIDSFFSSDDETEDDEEPPVKKPAKKALAYVSSGISVKSAKKTGRKARR